MTRDQMRASHKTPSPLRSAAPSTSAPSDPRMVAMTNDMVERRARITGAPSWYSCSVDFRKTYYILPNLFTLSSVFCGFISISLSASGQEGALYQAALAICFGFFFDTADGRVARLTKTQ